ncbi:hypothetical protein ABTM90_19875, partial [Acinetobacter baumannii]
VQPIGLFKHLTKALGTLEGLGPLCLGRRFAKLDLSGEILGHLAQQVGPTGANRGAEGNPHPVIHVGEEDMESEGGSPEPGEIGSHRI